MGIKNASVSEIGVCFLSRVIVFFSLFFLNECF